MIEARRDEIDSEAAKIEELINHLDEQKYESIKLTFDKVSENFSLVFKKLGTGFISGHFQSCNFDSKTDRFVKPTYSTTGKGQLGNGF